MNITPPNDHPPKSASHNTEPQPGKHFSTQGRKWLIKAIDLVQAGAWAVFLHYVILGTLWTLRVPDDKAGKIVRESVEWCVRIGYLTFVLKTVLTDVSENAKSTEEAIRRMWKIGPFTRKKKP